MGVTCLGSKISYQIAWWTRKNNDINELIHGSKRKTAVSRPYEADQLADEYKPFKN